MLCVSMLSGCTVSKSSEATTETQVTTKKAKAESHEESKMAVYFKEEPSGSPDIVAESAIVMDAKTGEVLYSKKADKQQYPASITKVMTALLAIEHCNMDDVIEFSNSAVNGIEAGSSSAGINVGAKLTVKETLYALMLVSANEAGAAIAEHLGGSNEGFAKMMNAKAEELGCKHTHFTNPHGLPDEKHYTCARDMALIMQAALSHKEFQEIASTLHYTLKKKNGLKSTLDLWNHAKILRDSTEYYYKYAKTSKTGFTKAALNTLVTSAKYHGVELICVILRDEGAYNSYYDTANLFKWAYDKVHRIQPLKDFVLDDALATNESLTENDITNITNLECTFDDSFYILTNKNISKKKVNIDFELNEDKDKGRIGYLHLSIGDKTLGYVAVNYDTSTKKAEAYAAGDNIGDGLETAKVDTGLTPTMCLWILIGAVVLFIIFYFTMSIIRFRKAKKRHAERVKRRNEHR